MGFRGVISALCLVLAAAVAHADLSVHVVQDDVLSVAGLTPGGQVVIFGAGRDRSPWRVEHLMVLETRVDDDVDGTVTVDLDISIPLQSVWWAVDYSTGDYAIGTPDGYTADDRGLPDGAIMHRATDDTVIVLAGSPETNGLVVRPGVGVWTVQAGDGALNDQDGSPNGVTEIPISGFQAASESGPADLGDLMPGDVLVLVNPRTLTSSSSQVAAAGR